MTAILEPRVVVVRRPTEYELVIEQHGTAEQVAFYLERQGLSMAELRQRDKKVHAAVNTVHKAIPRSTRSANLLRHDLDRFVFEPRDIIVVVGQDGLVANVAKYLNGQFVIGINPDPNMYEGTLVQHEPRSATKLLTDCATERASLQSRTMVEATLDDGQRLLALNEVFVGHRSHQSARYHFALEGEEERQSSSGLIVSTGTGSTGWARSINLERGGLLNLPKPEESMLAFFVREAFPGSGFATRTTAGLLQAGGSLNVISEMTQGGLIFGDGIEEDNLAFLWGKRLSIAVAPERLRLVA